MNYLQLDLFLAACGLLLILRYMYTRRQRLPLPPGPRPLPIIGNMLDIPKQKPWQTYAQWSKIYGDVFHLRNMGKSFIIINKFSAAYDLLEKKSSIYSGRPHFPMLELTGFEGGTVFMPYGTTWRTHRTLYQQQMGPIVARKFQIRQMGEAWKLLRAILDSPDDHKQHLRHMAAGVVMSIAYGHDILPKADPFVSLAEQTTQAFSRGIRPGVWFVDLIPALKHIPAWMPGAGFQKFAKESRQLFWEARNLPFEDAKKRMVAGTARPSFVTNALADLGTNEKITEEVIKMVAGGMFGAGSDTTVASMHSFILAMVLYPEVQKTAQAELDNVIGGDRLPEFRDRAQLPYLEAVIKEVLRWHPVAPTGISHTVTEEDVYHGYRIPKGTIVVANSWAILHDPEMYAEPFVFRPERFLPDACGRVERDPAITGAFGFGRRICPGRHLADASIWIGIASLLAAFKISPAVDEHGREIDVHYALDSPSGLLVHPIPFPCVIKPRSAEAETLIRQTEQSGRVPGIAA